MFEEYENLIRQYHEALLLRDVARLRLLVAGGIKIDLDSIGDQLDQMKLPLSGDIEITGISVEGSGKLVTVHYVSKLKDQQFTMVAFVRQDGETIKLNHVLPLLN